MSKSTSSGPLQVGTVKEGASANLGSVILAQQVAFVPSASITSVTDADGQVRSLYNGIPATAWALTTVATAALATVNIPALSSITDIVLDQPQVTTGGTAINVTAGTTAGGVEFCPAVDVKAGGRIRPTFTTNQLNNLAQMPATPLQLQVVPTVSPVTAGVLIATITYVQK